MNKKTKRLIMLNFPYVLVGLLATNLGEAWRLAVGSNATEKIQALVQTIPQALSNPLPSLHPFDLLVGAAGGGILRLAVYLKGKNARKFRNGVEYGSAKWGTAQDIEPFMDPEFKENVILTKTERLSGNERYIFLGRFHDGLSMEEVAHELHVTKSCVCKIEKKIMDKLKLFFEMN